MTRKVRVAPNLAIAGPFIGAALRWRVLPQRNNKTELPSAAPEVAPSEERCTDLHAPRGAALCLTRLRVWQKSRGRGGKSPALLVSSILNASRYQMKVF